MQFSVVAVAQLVESRIVIPVVVGSSPISHPIIPSFGTKLPIRQDTSLLACEETGPSRFFCFCTAIFYVYIRAFLIALRPEWLKC